MIALIDNYDSFTFNVYDYLMKFTDIRVFRNTDSLENLKTSGSARARYFTRSIPPVKFSSQPRSYYIF